MPRGVKKGLNSKKFEMCVTKVKRKSGEKVNPYAVVMLACRVNQNTEKNSVRLSKENFPSFVKYFTKNN